jgi:hypothetical protein
VEFEGVLFAPYVAVDVKVDGGEHAVGFSLIAGFDAGGVVGVIKKSDLLADERDGSFVETAGQGDGAVFGHAAAGLFTEVILEIFGRRAHTLAVSGIAVERGLPSAAVRAVVVDIS